MDTSMTAVTIGIVHELTEEERQHFAAVLTSSTPQVECEFCQSIGKKVGDVLARQIIAKVGVRTSQDYVRTMMRQVQDMKVPIDCLGVLDNVNVALINLRDKLEDR